MHEKVEFDGRAIVQMERYCLTEDQVREILGSHKAQKSAVPGVWFCVGAISRDTTLSVRFLVKEDVTLVVRVTVLERL